MASPLNAGNWIGRSGDPNVTGPMYLGAALATVVPYSMPPGWAIARTPGQAVGWYRITHNLGTTQYAVFGTSRNDPKVVATPSNYQSNFFDINTSVLPSAADADKDFAFILITLGG